MYMLVIVTLRSICKSWVSAILQTMVARNLFGKSGTILVAFIVLRLDDVGNSSICIALLRNRLWHGLFKVVGPFPHCSNCSLLQTEMKWSAYNKSSVLVPCLMLSEELHNQESLSNTNQVSILFKCSGHDTCHVRLFNWTLDLKSSYVSSLKAVEGSEIWKFFHICIQLPLTFPCSSWLHGQWWTMVAHDVWMFV